MLFSLTLNLFCSGCFSGRYVLGRLELCRSRGIHVGINCGALADGLECMADVFGLGMYMNFEMATNRLYQLNYQYMIHVVW